MVKLNNNEFENLLLFRENSFPNAEYKLEVSEQNIGLNGRNMGFRRMAQNFYTLV
jgi:hypothetical protein